MIERDYEYFNSIREFLIQEHHYKFVIISKKKIVGYFDSFEEAFIYADRNNLDLWNFIIQECISVKEEIDRYYKKMGL